MSKKRSKAINLVIAFFVIILMFAWIPGLIRDASPTNADHSKFIPAPSFKGQIVVSITERLTGPERNLEYLIYLDRGQISAPQDEQPTRAASSPGGHLDEPDCKETIQIIAPDHELMAYCKGASDQYTVKIQGVKNNAQATEWSAPKGWVICGLVWSPDSNSIAVLLERERTDLDPIGLVSLISGHPIPLITFKVILLSGEFRHELELPVIRKDSPSGWGYIAWIQ